MAAGVTLALFLLRVAGPHAPELDPVPLSPVVPLHGPVVPRGVLPPAQPPAEVPRIAPGRPLSDVTVAPTPDGDRFGTFTPGRHPMTRSALFLSASLFVLASAVSVQAQAPATPPAAPAAPSQFDRIEGKLDELLRRLDQSRPQPSGTGQAGAAVPGAPIPSPLPGAAPGASQEAYRPGALAVAHVAPANASTLADVPPDSVGGFVYEGGPIPFTDIRTRGVRYAGSVGVELQGWLRAREAGRYQLGADFTARFGPSGTPPTCFLQAWLEGRSLDGRSILVTRPGSNEATASLVLGAELQPGLYRLRVWSACTASQGVATTAELLLKAPSELNLRPVTGNDLLHREG